jgi:enoyl-[acyl-carrier protein] reductase III
MPSDALVVVTGGTKGIGRATAELFCQDGFPVVITYRQDRASAEATLRSLEAIGSEVIAVQCDLSLDRTTVIEAVVRDGRPIHALVVNAAASAFKPLLEMKPHHVERTFGVTVTTYLELLQGLAGQMSDGSSVVAISSGDTVRHIPGHGLLGGAKAALETLTRYIAVELAPRGIRANCVLPGPVATESARIWAGENWTPFVQRVSDATPLGRLAEPEDIARVIRLLTQPDAYWVNGQVIVADGGMFLRDLVFG